MTVMSEIAGPPRVWKRFGDYRISKPIVFLLCVASMAAAVAVGFTWGGWVTSSAAMAMSDQAASGGEAKLAATICADRFITGPHAQAQANLLRKAETGQRASLLRQGGWLTLPGLNEPVAGSAELCVQQIFNTVPSAS